MGSEDELSSLVGTVIVEGVNSEALTHNHPIYSEICTEDVFNVQNALLNPTNDTVVLRGAFYFAGLGKSSGVNISSAKTLTALMRLHLMENQLQK
ncbi:MAG: hypothetical protein ACXADY_23285 [Candidatus Hodarchaeales archaeon]|jgi:hypothetical protein